MSSSRPLLDLISSPADLRRLTEAQLPQLSKELRSEMIESVSKTGGHLGAGLGVVELTIALHYVFNTPYDRLIWDVGHQAYPHKILTGRRPLMSSLRQEGGLSGFTKRAESAYDPFGAGHSSTSISAALGMAVASCLKGEKDRNIVAVIGDGALSAGMAYEAMNNAGSLDAPLLVILNDNDMSIAPPTGAMSAYLSKLASSSTYLTFRERVKRFVTSKMSRKLIEGLRRSEEFARGFFTGGTLFEELGFYYVGPIDGHDFSHLLPVLRNLRRQQLGGPVLLHVVTKKGQGYAPAEQAVDKYHGVGSFDISTGKSLQKADQQPSFTKIFADALCCEAEKDEKIVAITAAMPTGTGLDIFAKRFKDRMFDVGIAEQHAVTFAAGLACEGYKPFVAIYSTFLQRGYDQIVHDVALQKLPVRFAIDRAGFVGADGPTHAGCFDINFLTALPNFVVMAPADEQELQHMVCTAAHYNDGPISFRYPRGGGAGKTLLKAGKRLEIGKGRLLKEGGDIALLCLGTLLNEALKASEVLEKKGFSISVADARFVKPLDKELICNLAQQHKLLLTIEEGSQGGFGAHVLEFLSQQNLLNGKVVAYPLTFPDMPLAQAARNARLAQIGLDAEGIAQKVIELWEANEYTAI